MAAKATVAEKFDDMMQGSFAYKMMRKMGWSEGKGLGKREDGIRTNIKVEKKTDCRGIGSLDEESTSMEWTANAQSFSNLLDSLNKAYQAPQKKKVKAKKIERTGVSAFEPANLCPSRAKRVRAKNISLLSEQDRRAIFGCAPSSKTSDYTSSEERSESSIERHVSKRRHAEKVFNKNKLMKG